MKILFFCFIMLVQYRSYKVSCLKSGIYSTCIQIHSQGFSPDFGFICEKIDEVYQIVAFYIFIIFIYPGIFLYF